jgi:hypothetical protein
MECAKAGQVLAAAASGGILGVTPFGAFDVPVPPAEGGRHPEGPP